MKQSLAVLVALLTASCTPSAPPTEIVDLQLDLGCPEASAYVQSVALPDLVASPETYEGKSIRVAGYYYSYFEHSAIYPTPEHEPYSKSFATGAWVLGGDDDLTNQYVTMTGTFTKEFKGHLGQWPGTICVTSMAGAPPPHAP